MANFFTKLLSLGSDRQVKRLENVAKEVNALEDQIAALSDEELKGQTAKFKQKLDNGATLDDIMAEAFATVREVSKRTLGQRHFDVQLMGGAALHWGNIAELKHTTSESVPDAKEHYQRGGLGDMKVKKFLNNILQEELEPIRQRRAEFAQDIPAVYAMLRRGCEQAREVAAQTLSDVRRAMKINYFDDADLIKEQAARFAQK